MLVLYLNQEHFFMEDDGPVTALAVLPPSLKLIPMGALTKLRNSQIALLEQKRADALLEVNKTNVVLAGLLLADGLALGGLLAALVGMVFFPVLILAATSAALAALTVGVWRISVRQTNTWRELDAPPHLQLPVVALHDTAKLANEMSAKWNLRLEVARQYVPEEESKPLDLHELKKDREEIASRILIIHKATLLFFRKFSPVGE